MAEIIIVQDDAPAEEAVDDTVALAAGAALAAATEAAADADEAQATAEVAIALASTAVCCEHCVAHDEQIAMLLEMANAQAEEIAVEDAVVEAALVEAEADVHPAPPVKEAPAVEEKSETEAVPKSKRSGVSKGWFGARAR